MFHLSAKKIQTIKIILHSIFIAVVTFEFLNGALQTLPNNWLFFLTSGAVENFLCATIAYVLYYFVFKSDNNWKKIGFVILFISILFSLASLKNYRIHDSIAVVQSFEYFKSFTGESLLLYLVIFMIDRFEFLRRYTLLEKDLNLAKAQLLRNQLHPHFLYNAFNSLYSLSLNNHPETPDYILKLSGMMRYLTDETNLTRVPLYKEIDFIEKYIAIEKIRFGKDARIRLNIADLDDGEKWIEPFLLITLVENAFKHGFYTNMKNAFVKIDLKIGQNELECTVENSFFAKQHFQEDSRKGKGLKNLRKRLELLYPKQSGLQITNTENTFTAHLVIQLNK
jgi:two-component system LytT family sensor kinase